MSAEQNRLLEGTAAYLSGPMDFVLDRGLEAHLGWRSRLTDVLGEWGVRVFDPWFKPVVRNLGRYGIEDETSVKERDRWTFDDGPEGAAARHRVGQEFKATMHIDLRMVDLSDFIIACCPTNLYSVGTPHEIVVARNQHKPVLLVSPPVVYRSWARLREALAGTEHEGLLADLARELIVKENPTGAPSMWYTSLVNSECFFDGFGWALYRDRFGWEHTYLDEREEAHPPTRPLLAFLERVRDGWTPQRWDAPAGAFVDNSDWLLLSGAEAAERRSAMEAI